MCGFYTLHQYIVESGGLTASYYPNKWFSPYGKPYLTRVDAVVNFSWDEKDDIIPNVAREYVSIEWVGYLKPAQTGDHLFSVKADDGVRLYVHGELIIDHMVDVGVGETHSISGQAPVALETGKLVPIRVQYYQSIGPARIALYWTKPTGGAGAQFVETTDLFHKTSDKGITELPSILSAEHTPQMPTGLKQSDSTTYEANALTIEWQAPLDLGCVELLEYVI